MLPITSVRSAKLYLVKSFNAQIAAWGITAIVIWAVLVSPAPVVVSVYLIFSLCWYSSVNRASGLFKISLDGYFEWGYKNHEFKVAELSFKPLFVVIYSEQGEKVIIWRGACEEADYRHLLVVLKLLHRKKRGEQMSPL
ncbi:hypothetical protein P7F88_14055 [Vibrio hannami]|uniref:hypothetical protein n=1 Tax=Vibrio hannami TaxID=2717094 RepID=UPI00241032C7|nr:hypothetical protein [Vibrio hannami]MDG3087145.1 hypothetical protein [Vibrio hannami]